MLSFKSTAGKTGNFAEWTGWDLTAGEPSKRIVKLQLSNKPAVAEFVDNFRKGIELAKLNEISEEKFFDAGALKAPPEFAGLINAPAFDRNGRKEEEPTKKLEFWEDE